MTHNANNCDSVMCFRCDPELVLADFLFVLTEIEAAVEILNRLRIAHGLPFLTTEQVRDAVTLYEAALAVLPDSMGREFKGTATVL